MKQETHQELIVQGKRLLGEKKPKEALSKFREIIRNDADNDEALYWTALSCIDLGLPGEALAVLREAHSKDPENKAYLESLGSITHRMGDFQDSVNYFLQAGIDNITDVKSLRLLAGSAEKTYDRDNQIKALERSLELEPDQEDSILRLSELRNGERGKTATRKKKIAVFTTNDYFLRDIITHLEKKYEVKKFDGANLSDIASLMRWSDLSWFEWCDALAVHGSKLPKYSKTICRLHRYEIFTDMPEKVNWKNIDHLVCVLDIFGDIAKEKLNLTIPVSIIRNGVNFSKYTIPPDKKYGKKIAYVGYIKKPKGPELLLQCFKKIHEYDPEYTFHIAGKIVDPEIEIYFDHMIKEMNIPVYNEGWVSDVPAWLEDKSCIISSSISESFMYAIVEGIACGVMPLVHNWPGSEQIYPGECLFLTADECLDHVKRYESIDRHKKAIQLRDYMQERFSVEKQINEIDTLIEQYI